MESKFERCMLRKSPDEHLTEDEMWRRIIEIDRNRASYYSFFSDRKWGIKESYDLLINTSNVDIKKLSEGLYRYLSIVL